MFQRNACWFGRALCAALVLSIALASAVCRADYIAPTHHFTFNIDDGIDDQAGALQGTAYGGASIDSGTYMIGDGSLRLIAGQQQYLSLSGPATPTGDTNAISVSMGTWVKRSQLASGHAPWYGEVPAANHIRFSFKDGGGVPMVDHWTGTGASPRHFESDATLPLDEWAHVMYTQNHTSGNVSRNFYVDGVLTRTLSNLTRYTGNSPTEYLIGFGDGQGVHFDGHLDDMGFWHDVELTAEYVALVHGLGRFSGVGIDNSVIGDVLGMHSAGGLDPITGVGDFNHVVRYLDNLDPAMPIGSWGGSVAGGDAYIVLGTGTGVLVVPEPGTWLLLLSAVALGLLVRRRRGKE